MTNPTHCAFTVQVEFKGTSYDVEITPTLNGNQIVWMQDKVERWTEAEKTHKLFSNLIVGMLNDTIPEYSLATHGMITAGSVKGFTFDKGSEITHTTQDIWDEFIDCLYDPVSKTAGLDPIDEDGEIGEIGLGAGIKVTPNAYLNLNAKKRKEVRLSLFEKKTCELFGESFVAYTPDEVACFEHLFQHRKAQPITIKFELLREWFCNEHLLLVKGNKNARADEVLSEQELKAERKEMSLIYFRVKQQAITKQATGNDEPFNWSDSEL